MNWKHLLYIIPLTIIISFFLGFWLGIAGVEALANTIDDLSYCQLDTLNYLAEKNNDCKILMKGYLSECINNKTMVYPN